MKIYTKVPALLLCLVLSLASVSVNAYSALFFKYNYTYDIGVSYVGEAITPYSVADGVSGGFAPYTFSKVSGPDWVKVSADGTVSGTPTKTAENGDMVLRVTDDDGNIAEITVFVAVTAPAPSHRAVISSVAATSENFVTIPHIGTKYYSPDFTVTKGAPASFDSATAYWQKKDGSFWRNQYLYSGYTFTPGTYRLQVRVELENNAGATHVFASNVSVSVNGVSWTVAEPVIYDDSSYVVAISPEFVLTASDVAPTFTVTYDTNGGNSIPKASGLKYYAIIPTPSAPVRDGYTFYGWYKDAELTEEVNWNYGITGDTTIYAKWIKNECILTELSFTVTAPAGGQSPSYSIVSTSPEAYTAVVDYWYLYENPYPALRKTDSFAAGQKYALRYTVILADGYVLENNARVTVNGISAAAYGSSLQQQVVFEAAADGVQGDVNADGYVDNLDAAAILKYDAGIYDLSFAQKQVADVNGDGYVDNLDAAKILKYDAGIIDSL